MRSQNMSSTAQDLDRTWEEAETLPHDPSRTSTTPAQAEPASSQTPPQPQPEPAPYARGDDSIPNHASPPAPLQEAPSDHSVRLEPASPPLPAKHTAITPGPRACRLQEVFDDRLNRTLERVSYANFAACYPTMAERAPSALQAVQRQMTEKLRQLASKEFQTILQSRDVVTKLNELESLVSDAGRRKRETDAIEPPIPPHLLPPCTILAAHLSPHLTAQQSQLNARLQTTQSLNAKLFADIERQRAEAARLLRLGAERPLQDVDGAIAQLDEVADALAEESRGLEGPAMSERTGPGDGDGGEDLLMGET